MNLFDPAEWIVLPHGSGLHRGDLGPCPGCGGASFEVRAWKSKAPGGEWLDQGRTVCPACVPARGQGKDGATGEVVRTEERAVAAMDAITGEMGGKAKGVAA